jgi:hypothetical protein
MDRYRLLVAGCLLVLVAANPATALAAGGPAPVEPCVPGTVWEDPASGVKYLCIYDEVFGGPRWVLMPSGQRVVAGMVSSSPTYGCLHLSVGLNGSAGGGADVVTRSYRWPCAPPRDRLSQPRGELRSRIVIQRYGSGGWATCRDSGYHYNTTTALGWVAGIDMGAAADCGNGSYRAVGFGAFYQGGSWRSGSLTTTSMWLP